MMMMKTIPLSADPSIFNNLIIAGTIIPILTKYSIENPSE
jgi:hypothetical protein